MLKLYSYILVFESDFSVLIDFSTIAFITFVVCFLFSGSLQKQFKQLGSNNVFARFSFNLI